MKKTIILPEEIVTNLERLAFENQTLKDNICFMLSTYKDDPAFLESPVFQKYEKKQLEKVIEYDKAKEEVIKNFATEGKVLSWNITFKTKELDVEYED